MTEELPLLRRIEVYKAALAYQTKQYLQYGVGSGFCYMLGKFMTSTEKLKYGSTYTSMGKIFPEISTYHPGVAFKGGYWFPTHSEGAKKRIVILEEILNNILTKNQNETSDNSSSNTSNGMFPEQ